MVRQAKTKTAVLVTGLLVIVMAIVQNALAWNVQEAGISKGATLLTRLTYHFFHANILHAVLNVWCLLSLAFIYDTTASEVIIAYIIASAYPVNYICSITGNTLPTVGLSAICFAIMGQVFWRVKKKRRFMLFAVILIAVGFLFPSANAALHLYAYCAGLIVGALTSPILPYCTP